jgi:hypothetical protein
MGGMLVILILIAVVALVFLFGIASIVASVVILARHRKK